MKVTILSAGSRGDVQPFVALGVGLARAGHRVRLAADGHFAGFVRAHGLDFAPVSGNIQAEMQHEWAALERRGGNPVVLLRAMTRHARTMAPVWAAEAHAACADADALLTGGAASYIGASLSELLGVPFVQGLLQPFAPTAAFPNPLLPPWRLPGWANRLSHRAMGRLVWLAFRPMVNGIREALGLAPWRRVPLDRLTTDSVMLCGVSPAVLPPPPDWPPFIEMTGYWFLDDTTGWAPGPDLAAFLEAGPPPVYVGFGSMADRKAAETTGIVLGALRRSGRRAIVAAGWGGLGTGALPDTVFPIEEAPHDRLLPLMAAAVHHGGAGTTAAVLRAGIPAVVVPVLGDQAFWAHRVAALGCSGGTIPRRRLTAERLTAALARTAADPTLHHTAAALATRIRTEDGVGRAVARFEAWVEGRWRPQTEGAVAGT
jgi:UDP:flavonoid glycosyltransferase YjiC (YdhE family)